MRSTGSVDLSRVRASCGGMLKSSRVPVTSRTAFDCKMPMQFALDEPPVGHIQKVGKLPGPVVRVWRCSVDVAKTLAYRSFGSSDFHIVAIRRNQNVDETLGHAHSPFWRIDRPH